MSAAPQVSNLPDGYVIVDESKYTEFVNGVSVTDPPLLESLAGKDRSELLQFGLYHELLVTDIDGLLVDSETGEVIGIRPPEEVSSDEKKLAEWALSRIQQSEAAAESVEQTQLVIQARAILTNAEKLKADHLRSGEYLRWKYFSLLKKVAGENLPKGKKTWTTLHGSVAFRATKEKVSVADSESAAAWLLDHDPAAVRIVCNLDQMDDSPDLRGALVEFALEAKQASPDAVEISPMVSKIGENTKAALVAITERKESVGADGKPITIIGSTGFSYSPVGESVTIKTGVGS